MPQEHTNQRTVYVGMHDGVCTISTSDGGQTWRQGSITPLVHAAARLAVSPAAPHRAYLAAYEAGVYRTDDGGLTWQPLSSYPSAYAHSVLAHPQEAETVYVGSEPATLYRSQDGGSTWQECTAFRAVPEAHQWFFHSDAVSPVFRGLMAMEGGHMIPGQGALPVYRNGELIGVVGGSGGTAQQHEDAARAGIEALGLSTVP